MASNPASLPSGLLQRKVDEDLTNHPVVFVDTETTGLVPGTHELWEIALIENDGTEWVWQVPCDLGKADPMALKVSRYYERRLDWDKLDDSFEFVAQFEALTRGMHIVGAVPSFDDQFLKDFFKWNNGCPGWHYHLIDVETMAIGWLAAKGDFVVPPYKSDDLTRRMGLDIPEDDKHTALGDARWAKAIYERIMLGKVN